jgi:arylsulfatase A-like enzyme
MKSYEFAKFAAAGCAAIGAGTLAAVQIPGYEPGKPNIIYILSDDSGIGDYEPYGQKKIKTPFISKLAADGMKFTQHYSGSTVCAPARCSLMTGMHMGHATIRGNSKNVLKPEDFLVSEMLKKDGYTTMVIGKWGLGDREDGPGDPQKHGFDYFYGFRIQGRAHHYYPEYVWRNQEKVNFPDNPTKRNEYIHDHFTEEGLNFIRQNAGVKPFFLYMAYTISHVDLDVPEDSMAPYHKMFDPEKPYKGNGKGGFPGQPTPHAAWAGMISRMDRDIGRIMDLVKEKGVDNNTIILFASDNGVTVKQGSDPDFFDSNGPYRGHKRDLYEGGVRVPFIVRWPGKISPGTVTDHLSTFWDFMPTVADIIGAPPPENIDGISYLPTLLGHPDLQKKHKYLYWEFYEQGGKQAVRLGNWKGVRLNVKGNPDAPIELYNLKDDIGETKNVAEQHPEIIQQMLQIMKESHTPSKSYSFEGKSKGDKKKKKKASGEGKKKKGKKKKKKQENNSNQEEPVNTGDAQE